jgi:hypothetical protein
MVSYLLDEFRDQLAFPADPDPCLIMKAILLVSLLILLLPASPAEAAQDLYVGEVAVLDQGGAERSRALPLALEQVLQKLTGLRQFDDYPLVTATLDRAPDMLLSYHYSRLARILSDGAETEELHLVARFDDTVVDELARSLQLPLWQPQRQPLLVWQIIDDGLGRRIMPVEFEYTRQAMTRVAEQRGLPLLWPIPDAEGLFAVDEQIIWGGYTEDLVSPQGEGVLIAAARREGASWGVRINAGYQGQHWTWRLDDLDLEAALVEGMQQAIDQIAAANTIAAADLGSWQYDMTIAGLGGPADYLRCLNYLQSISVVEGVAVVSAQPGTVRFRLALTALPRYLEEALDAGSVLQRTDPGSDYALVAVADDER